MPHGVESIVDVLHDGWRFASPAELEQLLPDVTGVSVNHGLWNTAKELVHHHNSILFRNRVKGLLNDVASKRIHAEAKSVAADRVGNSDDLLWGTMLEATLDQEITEAVDHQGIGLSNDCFDNLEFLLRSANLELLLEKDGSLLIIAMNDLVNDEFPVTVDCLVKHATVVDWLVAVDVSLQCLRRGLAFVSHHFEQASRTGLTKLDKPDRLVPELAYSGVSAENEERDVPGRDG
jgi:hypothetical protein